MDDVVAELERSVQIDAPVDRVWELVCDPRRLAEWSPTVQSTILKGADEPGAGVSFTNRNKDGDLEWTTHGEVVRFEPSRALAFRITENWAVWSFELEPVGGGTRLTQRRDLPDGLSQLSWDLTEGFMGGQVAFTASLVEGMEETLRLVKAAAEA